MLGWEFFCCCKVSHMKHPNAGCAVILHSVPTVKLLPIVENHNAQIQLWFPLKQKGWQPLVVETLYFFAILFWLFHFFCGTIMLMLMLLSSKWLGCGGAWHDIRLLGTGPGHRPAPVSLKLNRMRSTCGEYMITRHHILNVHITASYV